MRLTSTIKHIKSTGLILLLVFSSFLPLFAQYMGIPEVSETAQSERDKIYQRFQYLKEENRFTDYLDLGQTVEFPVGIRKTIGGLEYIIAIDSVVLTPEYAYLNASMLFKPPQSEQFIAFRGTDIRFTQNGGLSGTARLELVGDYLLETPGKKVELVLRGEETYVEWDCDGFSNFMIGGGVVFSRDLLIPTNPSFEPLPEGQVIAEYSVNIYDWNDLIASAQITSFQIPGLKDFNFRVGEILIDFSDLRNPTGVMFSSAYQSDFMVPGLPQLWRGAYLNELEVILPRQFNNGEERSRITASRLWIDEFGLSGEIQGENVLPLEGGNGSMANWPFSVEEFTISLTANRLNHASFGGEVVLPIAEKQSSLRYDAFIDDKNDYFFNLSPTDSLSLDVWQADVEIYASSYINVTLENGKFKPTAMLNGKMDIQADGSEIPSFKLPELGFEQLKIVNKPPFIEGGVFFPESNRELPELGSFKLDLEEIGLRKLNENEIALTIDAGIILNSRDAGAFAADGGLEIITRVVTDGNRQKLAFDAIRIKEARINIDNGAYKFNGSINHYYNNAIYGEGFRGLIDAEFKPGIGVKAQAMFGKHKGINYWFADALARFTPALSIAPGLGIYGFGGGASYHMSRLGLGDNYSSSGIKYVPDANAGLGIRAAVNLGSFPDQSAFSGFASFELSFFKSGGMKNLNFRGEASFMEPKILDNGVDIIKEKVGLLSKYQSNQDQPEDLFREQSNGNKSTINGDININYDFANSVLHGNFQVFVNTPGGIIRGTGRDGRAGWAVFHFAPADWYVHIGTPQNRLGLKVGIGQIAATTNAYFMAGKNLPPPPPPNVNVSNILGGMDLDYMREEGLLSTGRGFAFGAALDFNTGDLEFWKFYARFSAGAGFDLMLRDYGVEARCGNNSGPIGLNGWYANGQAYAYFDGKIGIKVDLFNKPQKFDIINLSAAAVLQAKLPNPFWLRGVVGGNFSILNGLVSGSCKFEVTLGEECDLSNTSAVSGLKVIADITPQSDVEEVSVFTNPQAVFNLPVNKEFTLIDPNNVKKKFRIKLDYFRIRDDLKQIIGEIEWNDAMNVALIKPFEILPPEKDLKVEVQISYEENSNGSWTPVTSNGNIIIEQMQTEFATGVAPDFIPKENIKFVYPLPGMSNFYPQETKEGYLELYKGQQYLFTDQSYTQVGVISDGSGKDEFTFIYDDTAKRISYSLPDLKSSSSYNLQLIRQLKDDNSQIDENITASQQKVEGSSDISLRTKEATGVIVNNANIIVYESSFSSSAYQSFDEKINNISFNYTFRDQLIPWDVHRLESGFNLLENFTYEELTGSQYTMNLPMIRQSAVLTDAYFDANVKPLVYANYPINGVVDIQNRNIETLGLLPVKAVSINNSSLHYDLPVIYQQDFTEIRNKVIPLYINKPNPLPDQVRKLLFYSFPIIPEGNYPVKFEYFLPGQSVPNSTVIIDIKLDFSN